MLQNKSPKHGSKGFPILKLWSKRRWIYWGVFKELLCKPGAGRGIYDTALTWHVRITLLTLLLSVAALPAWLPSFSSLLVCLWWLSSQLQQHLQSNGSTALDPASKPCSNWMQHRRTPVVVAPSCRSGKTQSETEPSLPFIPRGGTLGMAKIFFFKS